MGCVTRHFTNQQQRRVTQLHALASLHGQRSDLLGRNLRNQFTDAPGNLHAILVELALPQHAGEDRAAQSLLRSDGPGRRSLVGAQAGTLVVLRNVQAHGAPPFMRMQE